MTKLIVTWILIGGMNITAYQPLEVQTDNLPCEPANGKFVHMDGVAVSRDLHKRWGGPLNFGDTLYIEGIGVKIVNDVMGKTKCAGWEAGECVRRIPIMRSIDVFVWTQKEEAYYWKKFGKKKVKTWKVRFEESHKSK